MNENAIRVGYTVFDPTMLLLGVAGFAAFVLLTLLIVVTGIARRSAKRAAQTSHLEAELAELKSRLQTIAEISESRHEELTRWPGWQMPYRTPLDDLEPLSKWI